MKFNLSANLSGKLDAKKGTIRDVSIISEGEALGHGVQIDTKTLSGLFELQKSSVLKAHWTHGDVFSGDRLGAEVGLFSAFHISGNQLKAHFQVLEAFRTSYPERYAYLFELAEKAPNNFGVSIAFEGEAVWVLDTGAEVPADGERPANALGSMPSVRAHKVFSADFVSDPAANAGGLFSRGKLTELLDGKQKLSADIAELTGKLSAAEQNVTAKEATITELNGKLATAGQTIASLETKGKEADTLTASLNARIIELVATLDAKAKAMTDELAALNSSLTTTRAEHDAQMTAMKRTLVEFGAVPVNIYTETVNHFDQWAAIKDPSDKARYFKKHKPAILNGRG